MSLSDFSGSGAAFSWRKVLFVFRRAWEEAASWDAGGRQQN
jgi:hypothetical protein